MRVIGKAKMLKYKKKHFGNRRLCNEIDKLMSDLEEFIPAEQNIFEIRKDADSVHSKGFYFFNIDIHRTLIMIEFDDEGEATIVWVGNHQAYISIFRNNKQTIEKWLRFKNYIE